MTTRPYVSPVRSAAAAKKRDDVIRSATKMLRQQNISSFSLEAVAKAAGVTRLTVYNQFGSRRGLLEAVLDEIARSGGLTQLSHIVDMEPPEKALDSLVDIFCDFWSGDPAIGRLHDAIVLDTEFGEALLARNERRRDLLDRIVERMSIPNAAPVNRSEAIDLMFALTSYAMYRMLAVTQPDSSIRSIIKQSCADAVARTFIHA